MTFWICSAIALSAGLVAAFGGDLRRMILALWVAGLGIGGIYLAIGAEFLALVQWITSTLIVVSLTLYSVMFGDRRDDERPAGKRILAVLLPALAGACFLGIIALGLRHTPTGVSALTESSGRDLRAIGTLLVDRHFLALKLLALSLFLTLVGVGVIARPEEKHE